MSTRFNIFEVDMRTREYVHIVVSGDLILARYYSHTCGQLGGRREEKVSPEREKQAKNSLISGEESPAAAHPAPIRSSRRQSGKN